jgi:sugar phosphate isomerase/epimerase
VEEGNVKGSGKVRVGAALAATGAILSLAATAQAQRPANLGAGVPSGQTGIQLYNFNNYLNNGAGEIVCPAPPAAPTPYCVPSPAPTTSAGRLERVFAFLQSVGVKNVELYGYPGNPFPGTNPATPLNTAGLTALKALGDRYNLRFPGRHGNLTEANWDNQIAASKILGQDHIGEAGLPGGNNAFNSYQAVLNTVQVLNRLGKRSYEAGLGPAYFHNHENEFNVRYVDNGVLKSAWEIVMERTDPRYVAAQIDIGWAVCGVTYQPPTDLALNNAEIVRLINKFQSRVVSYHVKDMEGDLVDADCSNDDQREVGLGDVNFGPMFAAAKDRSKYYLMERDPVGIGGPTNFNPFINTANSVRNAKGDPAAVLKALPQQFASVPAGTSAAGNQLPIVVQNDGDAPLTITNLTVQAENLDGGTATAADFSIVSHNCTAANGGGPLAAYQPPVADDPATTDVNEARPAVPGGTCTVNVGFKPTRTNYTSVARLQFTSNSDNAMDRVLLAGRSMGESLGNVGGDVPGTLSLGISNNLASFGTFLPATARTYDVAMAATVVSTYDNAKLSVTDASTTAPGHLVNGTTALPQALQIRAANAAQQNPAYQSLSATAGTPVDLLSYAAPTAGADPVTLGFRQVIGATDPLRVGTYSKQLTFTLSTTTP